MTRDRQSSSNNAKNAAAWEEPSQHPRPRPLLAHFVSRMDGDGVWESKRKSLKSPHFSSVLLTKIHSQSQQSCKGNLEQLIGM